MRWTSFKEDKFQMGEYTVEIERNSNGVRTVNFSNGKPCFQVAFSSYNMEVNVPKPPEKVQRFKLSGKFLGITPVEEIFEQKYEADARLDEFDKASGFGSPKDLGLSIEAVEVEV